VTKKLHDLERDLVRRVLKDGIGRRDLFRVSAVSAGAAALSGGASLGLLGAAARADEPMSPNVKDMSQVMPIGGANATGRWFDYTSFMTPVEKFYVRNHYPTPRLETHEELEKSNWTLRIHGASVENPVELTYDDLLKLPARSIVATMECHGNGRNLFWEQQAMMDVGGGSWGLGAVGQAEWRYVPMSVIFDRVGLKDDAKEVLFWSGVDGADMGRPMPVADILERPDDIGLAFQMNGLDLPLDHGLPVRALVPGWGGTASIKWLREIRVEPVRFWTRLNVKAEAYIGGDHEADTPSEDDIFMDVTAEDVQGKMVRWMNPKSTLTVPLVLSATPNIPPTYPLERDELPVMEAGQHTMTGYAWAPHGVREVHYRIDGGGWHRAALVPPNLGRYTWVRFEFRWEATEGTHQIETRTTDNTGDTQPETYPFNLLGMTNNAIPKFRIQVV
jgi:DMSO/TMAO reductase YedYZ molybdopterin-dependent catalytic subunit